MARVLAREIIPKHPDESKVYDFDFANILADGETLSGTPIVDEIDSADLTIGTPQIVGSTVQARISGGSENTLYYVQCSCGSSVVGTTHVITGRLKVSRDEGDFPST